jgi:hypothetical protein
LQSSTPRQALTTSHRRTVSQDEGGIHCGR